MPIDKYKREILERLVSKYHERIAKNIVTNRKIGLKPTKIYKDYIKNNADMEIKQEIYEAVVELSSLGFITVSYLRFSEDIETMSLCDARMDDIYRYLEDQYGILPHYFQVEQVKSVIETYMQKDRTNTQSRLIEKYCDDLIMQIRDPRKEFDIRRIDANLKMLEFLENNQEEVYLREASMLVYGDSKWLEDNNYDEICTFLKSISMEQADDDEKNDFLLEAFHVIPNEQEIYIKGNWYIEWENFALDVSNFKGGVALPTDDIQSIKHIQVNCTELMTIENKTSFHRLNDSASAKMYLGGFANRHQIAFIKKAFDDNKTVIFKHFGDIDIGGFWIHNHLCQMTGITFELYQMGIEQLMDICFQKCLKKLTQNDLKRLETLIAMPEYREVLGYMRDNNIKLEQEIISYYLGKESQ